jgi:drug/metabolite transporter (DMT)-like permease
MSSASPAASLKRHEPSLLGPALVILGASMWGLETFWRLRLTQVFSSDVLVFHEHWIGLILTSPFIILGARALRSVSLHAWWSILLSGVLGSALGTVCFTEALTLMNPSLANLLLNVQPIISVLVSWFWLRERPRASFYPWAAAALVCGVALAWSSDALGSPGRLGEGLLFLVGTAFCWGASTTFGRGAMVEIDFKTGTGLRYLIGTIATFVIVVARGQQSQLHAAELLHPAVLRDMVSLLLFAAITPTFIYFAGLARTRASVATFAEMAQTFASLLITWGVLGNALTPPQLIAGALLLVAVHFINRSVDEAQPPPEPVVALTTG